MRNLRRDLLLAGLSVVAAPLLAAAQNQVDTRVGGELNGNNSNSSYPIPYQIRLLPSEERYAIWRSGALPSEVSMGRAAAGPLSPNGVLDYLPRRSSLQQAYGMPGARLYNPAYDPMLARNQRLDSSVGLGQEGGYPQTVAAGLRATTNIPGQLAGDKSKRDKVELVTPGATKITGILPPIPSLTPAPDQPLPTGQLSNDVTYNPDSSPATKFLNRPLARRPAPATKPSSLSDEKNEKE